MRKGDPRFAVNTSWTAMEPQRGWRHFRIVDRRWREERLEVELMAVCDRAARFWIFAEALLDPARYHPGWSRDAAAGDG